MGAHYMEDVFFCPLVASFSLVSDSQEAADIFWSARARVHLRAWTSNQLLTVTLDRWIALFGQDPAYVLPVDVRAALF